LTTEKIPDPIKAEPEEKAPEKEKILAVAPNEKKENPQLQSPTHPPPTTEETEKDK
jgi:hypothetical protein